MPRVSVIMPSYNKEKYIAKSIKSILNQTYRDFELLIIDDVSTDSSVEIIRSFDDPRIRFYQNEQNVGMAANRNIGIEKAGGEFIALLDADDLSTEYRLEKEVQFLDDNPDIDVVFGAFDEIDENDTAKVNYYAPLKNPAFIKARLLVQDVVPNGSCMYRKQFVDRYKIRYRDGCLGMDDYLFWIECSLYGRLSGMQDLFLHWRNTTDNNTSRYMFSKEYESARRKKYAQIHRFALESSGFSLTEQEYELYSRVLSEYQYKITKEQEVRDFYSLICKLCRQSEKMDNGAEVRKMYRRQFGMSLENSYIWDD